MRKIVLDIETKNFFSDTGSNDPASLDLACVCIHDSATGRFESFREENLKNLWPILEKTDVLIGFNSDHFDIPLLNKYYRGDLTKIKSIDLLKEVRRVLGRRLKLDTLAKATLGSSKTADGTLSVAWWKNSEYEKVIAYCIEDVRITKALYEYALKHGNLKYRDNQNIKEIKLNTSEWEREPRGAHAPTLPF